MKQAASPDAPGSTEWTIDADQEARLRAFLDLVLHWTSRIDLIAPVSPDVAWQRHVLDSLQLAALVPRSARTVVDLGSGSGFPGLVLAIATGLSTRLVESDQRKCAFLREAIRLTHAPAEVLPARAENLVPMNADVVSARALAPMRRLLPLVRRHLAKGGLAILPKGAGWQHELAELDPAESLAIQPIPSRTDPTAMILLWNGNADG